MKNKIYYFDDLVEKVKQLKKKGKTVVQSHGVYDVIHPGVIQHLTMAKKQGDILVVTIIKDKDVRRGPGRPIFNEKLRLENVASLQQVDYVALVNDEVPFESIRLIKPSIFAKGKAFKDRDQAVHGKIFEEERELNFGKIKIFETEGFSFNSQQLINNFLEIYPEDTKKFLKDFAGQHSFKSIMGQLNKLKGLKVLLVGDGIIDEYHYCDTLGKSAKNPIIVNKYLTHEVFAGGVFAIANHLSSLCDNIQLVTLLGRQDSREKFVSTNLRKNIKTKYFYREDAPTIVKKRYVSNHSNQKLFEVNYINDDYIQGEKEEEVIDYLKAECAKYDIVLISDFGHGFISEKVIKTVRTYSRKFAVNTQTNAANAGYNLITRYRKPYFVCLDESELRLAAQEKHKNIEEIAAKMRALIEAQHLIVTLGRKGSFGVDFKGRINRTPIFSTKVVDTIGAGDAFFAYTAPCFAMGMPLDLASFIGNAVGALAVQIIGNKKPVEKYEVMEFAHNLLRQ